MRVAAVSCPWTGQFIFYISLTEDIVWSGKSRVSIDTWRFIGGAAGSHKNTGGKFVRYKFFGSGGLRRNELNTWNRWILSVFRCHSGVGGWKTLGMRLHRMLFGDQDRGLPDPDLMIQSGTEESTLVRDSSVPLMHHYPSDLQLGSLILMWIIPNERTHFLIWVSEEHIPVPVARLGV